MSLPHFCRLCLLFSLSSSVWRDHIHPVLQHECACDPTRLQLFHPTGPHHWSGGVWLQGDVSCRLCLGGLEEEMSQEELSNELVLCSGYYQIKSNFHHFWPDMLGELKVWASLIYKFKLICYVGNSINTVDFKKCQQNRCKSLKKRD